MTKEFESLTQQMGDLLRGAYDAGVRAERQRILGELGCSSQEPRGRVVGKNGGYGEASAAVEAALAQATENGMVVWDLCRVCPDLDERQIRHAAKHLVISGRAVRVARGRFRLAEAG